jgi:hypothetical protein
MVFGGARPTAVPQLPVGEFQHRTRSEFFGFALSCSLHFNQLCIRGKMVINTASPV